jgi:glycoside/pentoside/hexuronide:cation symporter, GPH family
MKISQVEAVDRVPFKMKLGYGVGDFGANMVYQSIMLYLMYYFTDVFLISASAAGTIFLIAKLWDAITDPLVGYSSDRIKTRWGQKRPFLLFGAIPLGLSLYLLFASPPINEEWKFIFALFAFLFVCTTYTIVNIPYGALTASLTSDSHERSKLTGSRVVSALIGTLLVAGATKPLVGMFSDQSTGFRYTGLLYAILATVFTLITFFSVKERVTNTKDVKHNIADIKKVLSVNKPFMFLTFGMVVHFAAIGILAAMVNYFFKYNFQKESFITIVFLCLFATAALAVPIWVKASKKFGKKNAFNIGMSMLVVVLIVLYFIKEFNIYIFIPLFVFAGIGVSTMFFSPWAMIPDTVEYSEWRTGLRREGILYGFFYFGHKMAAAIAGFFIGQGLNLVEYVQPKMIDSVLTVQVQSEATLHGIRILMTIVPMVLIIIGIILISFYSIDEKLHKKMLEDIKGR